MSITRRRNASRPVRPPQLSDVLRLAQRGWAVFPVEPGSKEPYRWSRTSSCRWSQESTASASQIRESWIDGANVGVDCGKSGLIVIDLDRHGDDGVDAFTWLCKQHSPVGGWPDTFAVATSGDGYHLYFEAVDDHGNGEGSLPAGVNVRGRGGYVVGPGSIRHGRAYRVYNDSDAIPLPGWLDEILKTPKRGQARKKGPGKRELESMPSAALERKIAGILAKVESAAPGERNNILYWGACKLGEIAASGRIGDDDAEAALRHAARSLESEDGSYAVFATIQSGLMAGWAA